VVAPHSLCEDRSIVKTGSGQILVFKNLNKRLLHSFAGALLVIVGLDAIILGNFYGGAHLDASVENVPELKQDPYVQAMMVAWYVSIYSNHPNHNDARTHARTRARARALAVFAARLSCGWPCPCRLRLLLRCSCVSSVLIRN
jgi:hypothetical protein